MFFYEGSHIGAAAKTCVLGPCRLEMMSNGYREKTATLIWFEYCIDFQPCQLCKRNSFPHRVFKLGAGLGKMVLIIVFQREEADPGCVGVINIVGRRGNDVDALEPAFCKKLEFALQCSQCME